MSTIDDLDAKGWEIEQFIMIYEYLRDRPNTSFHQIAEYLNRGMTPQKISALIERLEKQLGDLSLIDRKPRSKRNTLTPAAQEVYKKGLEALRAIRSWPGRERALLTIGAPHLLIHTVLPRVVPMYRKHLAGQHKDIDIRIEQQTTLDTTIELVKKGVISFALCWIHDGNSRYISYISKNFNDIKIEDSYFGMKCDMLMVCPFAHEFVNKERQSNLAWKLDSNSLADQLVYVLPSQRQPLQGLLPAPLDPRLRVVQDTYMDIISRLRRHVSQGIGFVPSTLLPELNEMVRRGQILYSHVTAAGVDEERFKVKVGCITKAGIANLEATERRFFELVAQKLQEVSEVYYQPASIRRQIPDSPAEYSEFKKCYFVMQMHEMFDVPKWYEGDLNLSLAGEHRRGDFTVQKFKGDFESHTEMGAWHFDAEGELFKGTTSLNRLFQFEAWGKGKNHNNTIHCTFNMIVNDKNPDHDALVGVWSGRDDRGLPTIAPMIITRKEMDVQKIRMIVNEVSFRSLPNAEESYFWTAQDDRGEDDDRH